MIYKAFISYSHAVDGKLAPALQDALHSFAKPWYRLRAIRVFRDRTTLSATPALWPSIEKALGESEYFLLLASPESADSKWVSKEIAWWLTNRSPEKMLILLTEGELAWDNEASDFDWNQTTALRNSGGRRFDHEPLWVDLRWARSEDNLSLRHVQFRSAILDVAAPLYGRAKDELDGKDVREHRRTKRIIWITCVMLLALTLLAMAAAVYAIKQQDIAIANEREVTRTASRANVSLARYLKGARNNTQTLAHLAQALRLHPQNREAVSFTTALLLEKSFQSPAGGNMQHEESVWSAQFSPDGQRVVTASAIRLRGCGTPPLAIPSASP